MPLFDPRERRAILLFLPLVLLLTLCVLLLEERRTVQRAATRQLAERPLAPDSIHRFEFDPNTITYDSLLLVGFSRTQALQLLKYRAAGKVWRLAEELHLIYGMTDSLFEAIRPYVRIGEAYAYPERSFDTAWRRFPSAPARCFTPQGPFRIDTVSVDFLRSMGFSVRWSEALVRCNRQRGIRSMEELRELRFVGDSVADLLAPWVSFPAPEPDPYDEPVELNGADSATLCSLYGIGSKSAAAIIDYRRRLGGFHSVEQLAEVRGVTEANYEKILQQIWCDSFQIRKIDINFAPADELREHPYIDAVTLRKITNKRQQRKSKGGWSTVEEMVQENILTDEQARRLCPYLRFGTYPGNER